MQYSFAVRFRRCTVKISASYYILLVRDSLSLLIMGRKGLQALPILLLVLTMVCNILGAPVKEHVPPHAKSVELPSHITKGDVMLLKEKLAELEADLDQLEPVVPADTTADDDEEDEVDIEPLEETDEEEEIVPQAETEQDNPAPVEQQPPKAAVPAENEMETDPVVEHPEEVDDDDEDDEDDEEQEEEEDAGEGGQTEDVEETEGEWEEEEAVNEGIMPFVDPEEDDLYLRKLIVQALTVLYRKDADRIDRMLQQYEDKLIGDDVFEENIAPAPQDLMPNNAMGGQKLEPSAFADRPYTNEELHDEEVLQAMASKKRQDMNVAEHTLLSDMHTFEGKGITLDELLNDLEDKKNNDGQGLLVEPRNEARDELDEEEDALFGEYKEDAVVVDNEEAAAADEDPALSLQELQEIDNEGVNDAEHEVDDDDEEGPDDLLMELMANLNTSLKKFQENKASPQ